MTSHENPILVEMRAMLRDGHDPRYVFEVYGRWIRQGSDDWSEVQIDHAQRVIARLR